MSDRAWISMFSAPSKREKRYTQANHPLLLNLKPHPGLSAGRDQDGLGQGGARLGVQPDQVGLAWAGSPEVTEGRCVGWVQAGKGSREKGQPQSATAATAKPPLAAGPVVKQGSQLGLLLGGSRKASEHHGLHYASLAATTGTPQVARLPNKSLRL